MGRGCLAAVGIALAIFSSFFVIAAVVESATGGDGKTSPAVYAGLIVLFGGLMVAGIFLAWQMLKKRPVTTGGQSGEPGVPWGGPPTDADREREVLRFAESEHGRVTIPEVATRCNLTIADSKATLDRLVMQEAATIQVTQSGVLVYVFPGFLSDDDKANAKDF